MGRSLCVITLATADRQHYPASLARLEKSLRLVDFGGSVEKWPPGSFPPGCPSHLEVPFAFKPFCFEEARRRGFELILWLDSSCLVVRPLDRVFAQIEQRGYVLFANRDFKVGQWASDEALSRFGLDRDQAMTMPELNAAAIGLNMADPVAATFLERWLDAAKEGTAFRGIKDPFRSPDDYWDVKLNRSNRVSTDPRVRGHRHDQTVAGILAHELGMELSATGIQAFRRGRGIVLPSTVILKCRASARTDLARARIGRLLGELVHRGAA